VSLCDWFTWHVGAWSGVTAGVVVREVAEVVGKIAEVVGEIAEVVGVVADVVGEIAEVVRVVADVVGKIAKVVRKVVRWSKGSPKSPTLARSHLRHDISKASSELNRG